MKITSATRLLLLYRGAAPRACYHVALPGQPGGLRAADSGTVAPLGAGARGVGETRHARNVRGRAVCFRIAFHSCWDAIRAIRACSFAPGRPLLSAVEDLSRRIFTEFHYDRRATTIGTPVDEVLASRRGVCQDFAHVMIACLRSLELPARYVSGYLRSGGDFEGDEASHAWVSVWCPVFGWQDFDPTNNVMPRGGHFTVAWGRDYSDVTPVKGVALGGGEQVISVSVDVSPQATD